MKKITSLYQRDHRKATRVAACAGWAAAGDAPNMNGWHEDDPPVRPEYAWIIPDYPPYEGQILPGRWREGKGCWYIDWDSDHPEAGRRFDYGVAYWKPRTPPTAKSSDAMEESK